MAKKTVKKRPVKKRPVKKVTPVVKSNTKVKAYRPKFRKGWKMVCIVDIPRFNLKAGDVWNVQKVLTTKRYFNMKKISYFGNAWSDYAIKAKKNNEKLKNYFYVSDVKLVVATSKLQPYKKWKPVYVLGQQRAEMKMLQALNEAKRKEQQALKEAEEAINMAESAEEKLERALKEVEDAKKELGLETDESPNDDAHGQSDGEAANEDLSHDADKESEQASDNLDNQGADGADTDSTGETA